LDEFRVGFVLLFLFLYQLFCLSFAVLHVVGDVLELEFAVGEIGFEGVFIFIEGGQFITPEGIG
jgi:hypothetical protein